MKKQQKILNYTVLGISILILMEFLLGVLNWNEHWWILLAWFLPLFGGMYVFKNKNHNPKHEN